MRKILLLFVLAAAGCPDPKDSTPDATTPPPPPDSGVAEKKKREAPPYREATKEQVEQALTKLETWVKDGATDPKNPWALAHGMVGFGKDLKASDGRFAIDVMTADFLQKSADGWTFPTNDPATQMPVEPHKDLLIKTMLESGVPQSRAFKTKHGKVTLAQLVADATKRFRFPNDEPGWRNYAWSAYAMFIAHKQAGEVPSAERKIPFQELASKTLDRLEIEQKFLEELLGKPESLEKRRQGIYAHHCGGLHFVQAAVIGAGFSRDALLIERARRQLQLVFFRWEAERMIYKEALWNEPKYRWLLLVQELKFYGHVLETMALAKEYGVFEPDVVQLRQLRLIAGDLVETVGFLEEAYRKEAMAKMPPQTQFDLIGDGCHAIRGLRRSLVAFFAP